MCVSPATSAASNFLEVVTNFVLAAFLLLAAPEIANSEAYLCAIDRRCDITEGCKVKAGSPVWFGIEADGSAFAFSGHKTTQYDIVSKGNGSRTFFSDDHGDFPSMRTLYADGKFTESIHLARPENAQPNKVGPFVVSGTCKRVDGR